MKGTEMPRSLSDARGTSFKTFEFEYKIRGQNRRQNGREGLS